MSEEREPGAGAHRPTIDRPDDWFAEFPEAQEIAIVMAPHFDQLRGALTWSHAVRPHLVAAPSGLITLIHTRRKRTSRPGKNHGTDFIVIFHIVQRLVQLSDQAAADRVHRFRAIQSDENPFALLLVKNFLIVGHKIPLNPPLPKGEFLLWPRSQRFPSLEKKG